jgi:hypothetical protein
VVLVVVETEVTQPALRQLPELQILVAVAVLVGITTLHFPVQMVVQV